MCKQRNKGQYFTVLPVAIYLQFFSALSSERCRAWARGRDDLCKIANKLMPSRAYFTRGTFLRTQASITTVGTKAQRWQLLKPNQTFSLAQKACDFLKEENLPSAT